MCESCSIKFIRISGFPILIIIIHTGVDVHQQQVLFCIMTHCSLSFEFKISGLQRASFRQNSSPVVLMQVPVPTLAQFTRTPLRRAPSPFQIKLQRKKPRQIFFTNKIRNIRKITNCHIFTLAISVIVFALSISFRWSILTFLNLSWAKERKERERKNQNWNLQIQFGLWCMERHPWKIWLFRSVVARRRHRHSPFVAIQIQFIII